jgi:two-component system, cell cycle sensor histidine kinase and response regulator CckA
MVVHPYDVARTVWVSRKPSSSAFNNSVLKQSTIDLLQVAARICRAKLAVLYLDGKPPLASALDVSVDEHEFDSVAVVDSASQVRGRLAVLDCQPRAVIEHEHDLLLKIAALVSRFVEIDHQQSLSSILLHAVTVGAYIIENGRFSYVNEKFAATLGYTKEEILAMASVSEIIVDEYREFVEEMIRRRAAGDRREVRYVTRVRRRDGAIVDVEIHGSVAEIDGRQLIVGAAVDMTDQPRASQRLLEREEYFRALTEHSSDVIVILDRDGRRTHVSSSVERILGYAPEELIGESYFALIHPDDRDAVVASFKQLMADGPSPTRLSSYRFRRKDGAWRVLEVVATNLTKQWPVRGVVLNIRDITDRMRLEQQLGQLQRLNSLGRMAGQVAHEFNNVLMGISPVVDLIRRRAGEDVQLLRSAEMIAASIGRGKRVTTDILRFGRPAQPALKPVNVQELVRQVGEEVRPLLGERIKLDLQLPDSPLYVSADATQLTQVLMNLALNARDAMQTKPGGSLKIGVAPGKKLDVSSGDGDAFVHIAVSDSGSGITAADLPSIFEPLFTTKRSGTGLGLSVAFQIVTAHHGHISVDTEPEKGTTFHVFVPLVSAEPRHAESADRRPVRTAGKENRVLLVERDEAVVTGLLWSLEAESVTMHVARTGAELLPAIAQFKPDVVVLDLSFPDEDGPSMYQRMASVFTGPVIFSNGNVLESEVVSLLRNPRAAFLLKPYSAQDLLRIMNELLDIDREPEDAPFEPGGELPNSG